VTDSATTLDLETLWSAPERDERPGASRGAPMPAELQRRYGGLLEVHVRPDRPTLLVNFVSSLDGVVALGPGEPPGGGVISGSFEPDRFVMALLRGIADVLLMGSGTAAGSSSVNWVADHLEPAHAAAIGQWRRDLGLPPNPTAVIVTGSGELRLGRRGVEDPDIPIVFATTPRGAERLRDTAFPPHVTIEVIGSGDAVTPSELAAFLERYRGQVVLSEGGPHLLGGLVEADVVDELFLTLSPMIVGRGDDRLGLVEGLKLPPDVSRWHDLASVKRAGEHLFLRYGRRRPR
jgi:riboflavin biosynthesis pyrimidine reductase